MASPAHRIDLKDMTTPAHVRLRSALTDRRDQAEQYDRPDRQDHLDSAAPSHRPVAGPTGWIGPAGNLTLLAGVWLVISGIAVNYHETGMFDAYWSDVVVGIALGVIALVCLVNPTVTPSLVLTRLVLGGWLVAAPFALGYGDVARPRWNDITVGVVVIALAAFGSGTPERASRSA
jgi:hypothetical protein